MRCRRQRRVRWTRVRRNKAPRFSTNGSVVWSHYHKHGANRCARDGSNYCASPKMRTPPGAGAAPSLTASCCALVRLNSRATYVPVVPVKAQASSCAASEGSARNLRRYDNAAAFPQPPHPPPPQSALSAPSTRHPHRDHMTPTRVSFPASVHARAAHIYFAFHPSVHLPCSPGSCHTPRFF